MTRPDGLVLTARTDSTGQLMYQVMLALIPGTLLSVAWLGTGVLLNLVMAIGMALAVEALALQWRGRAVKPALTDGSMVLGAWLLALCLPPLLPLWQVGFGALCMAALGKHLFGGLGQNPFNPAMVGYAALIVSFPHTMSAWSAEPIQGLSRLWEIKSSAGGLPQWLADTGSQARADTWDAITRQTPLDAARSEHHRVTAGVSRGAAEIPAHSRAFVWINICWLAGGLYLLLRRVISWHIPVAMLAGFTLTLLLLGSHSDWPLWLHLFSGGLMLGAFFIATDPVSAATSPRGRLVYAAGIGVLSFVLREYSNYPDGVAFAVLLMNLCVPLIDQHITRTGRPR